MGCVCVCVYMCVMHIQCAYVSVCMREGRVAEREGKERESTSQRERNLEEERERVKASCEYAHK